MYRAQPRKLVVIQPADVPARPLRRQGRLSVDRQVRRHWYTDFVLTRSSPASCQAPHLRDNICAALSRTLSQRARHQKSLGRCLRLLGRYLWL